MTLNRLLFFHFQKIILSQSETSDQKIDLLQKVLKFVDCLKNLPIYNELFMNIHGVMLVIIETSLTDKRNVIETEIQSAIMNLADCETKTIILQKLQVLLN